jgi:Ser/Thr protein kinase RdoA (MazF antagonist)
VIPTLRSLPVPQALRAHLQHAYGFEITGCALLRSLVNDVYEIGTPKRRMLLKLYRAGNWSIDEVSWEVELAAHLAAGGVPVPQVQPLADGKLVGKLDSAEGIRPFTLAEFIEGGKPRPPFDDNLYGAFGRLVAAFHDTADSFSSKCGRRPSDLRRQLDDPLAAILPILAGDDRVLVSELAAAARVHITQYAAQGLGWGVCHGDVTLDNILVTSDGLSLHDFDLAAEGWRAADLTGVASTSFWDAFAGGYTSRRALSEVDVAAIGWFDVIGRIFNLRFHLYDKPLIRGTESVGEGWADRELAGLRRAAGELL